MNYYLKQLFYYCLVLLFTSGTGFFCVFSPFGSESAFFMRIWIQKASLNSDPCRSRSEILSVQGDSHKVNFLLDHKMVQFCSAKGLLEKREYFFAHRTGYSQQMLQPCITPCFRHIFACANFIELLNKSYIILYSVQ